MTRETVRVTPARGDTTCAGQTSETLESDETPPSDPSHLFDTNVIEYDFNGVRMDHSNGVQTQTGQV
jgi:hypothetical protein